LGPSLIFQQHRDAMAAHRLFGKRAGTFRDEVTVFQSDVLLVQAGIADDGGRDLSIIGLDDTDAIPGQVLMGDLKGRGIRHGLDHFRGQQSKSLGTAGNFVSHLNTPVSCTIFTHDGLSVTSELNPVKR
jgi:hypothetical protein